MQDAVLAMCGVKSSPTFDEPNVNPTKQPRLRIKGLGEGCGGTMIESCMKKRERIGVKDHQDLQAAYCWKCDGVQ